MMTRAQRTGLASALGVAACLACSAPARGREAGSAVPVTVVAVRTDDVYPQAGALTKALRNALKEVPGWTLGEGDFSLEVLTLSLKCSDVPDPACQTRIANEIKSDRYIWGTLAADSGNVKGELHLWARGEPLASTRVSYSMNLTEPNDEALRKVASDAITALTGGPPNGSLRVRTGASTGQVFIDGKLQGTIADGEATFDVPAGSHKILVKAAGFVDTESAIVVEPVGTTDLALSQLPVEVEPQVNWRKLGGYTGIGAGVAFATVAVLSSTHMVDINDDADFKSFRALFPRSVGNVCSASELEKNAEARKPVNEERVKRGVELCDRADTFTALQFVFYPLALVSAGFGAYLVATSHDHNQPPGHAGWSVQPAVGLDRGKLDVIYRW